MSKTKPPIGEIKLVDEEKERLRRRVEVLEAACKGMLQTMDNYKGHWRAENPMLSVKWNMEKALAEKD